MQPIGHMQSLFKFKNGTPRQPGICQYARGTLTIDKSIFNNPEHSLEGLQDFSHAWIIFVFHKNTNPYFKAKVRPPRLDGRRIGLFATRAPYRPNPIGLTLAKIERISGSSIHFSGIDLLDGTPVLDVKPFIPQYDCPLAADHHHHHHLAADHHQHHHPVAADHHHHHHPLAENHHHPLAENHHHHPLADHHHHPLADQHHHHHQNEFDSQEVDRPSCTHLPGGPSSNTLACSTSSSRTCDATEDRKTPLGDVSCPTKNGIPPPCLITEDSMEKSLPGYLPQISPSNHHNHHHPHHHRPHHDHHQVNGNISCQYGLNGSTGPGRPEPTTVSDEAEFLQLDALPVSNGTTPHTATTPSVSSPPTTPFIELTPLTTPSTITTSTTTTTKDTNNDNNNNNNTTKNDYTTSTTNNITDNSSTTPTQPPSSISQPPPPPSSSSTPSSLPQPPPSLTPTPPPSSIPPSSPPSSLTPPSILPPSSSTPPSISPPPSISSTSPSSSSPSAADWVVSAPVNKLHVSFTARALQQLHQFDQSTGRCSEDYRLEFLKDVQEVQRAICSILHEDPRSVYRRNACADSLYFFCVDKVHVTCWFFENSAEVLRVQPTSHSEFTK
ncbi:hypothetical protein Ahia01_001280200 [Argonauta hians]